MSVQSQPRSFIAHWTCRARIFLWSRLSMTVVNPISSQDGHGFLSWITCSIHSLQKCSPQQLVRLGSLATFLHSPHLSSSGTELTNSSQSYPPTGPTEAAILVVFEHSAKSHDMQLVMNKNNSSDNGIHRDHVVMIVTHVNPHTSATHLCGGPLTRPVATVN